MGSTSALPRLSLQAGYTISLGLQTRFLVWNTMIMTVFASPVVSRIK